MDSQDLVHDLTFMPGTPGAAMTWQVGSVNGAIYAGSLSQGVSGATFCAGTAIVGTVVSCGNNVLSSPKSKPGDGKC